MVTMTTIMTMTLVRRVVVVVVVVAVVVVWGMLKNHMRAKIIFLG